MDVIAAIGKKLLEVCMGLIEKFYKVRKARIESEEAEARTQKTKLELVATKREEEIEKMRRRIETMIEQEREKYPGKHIDVPIQRAPEDDEEIFREAMRRIDEKRKHGNNPTRFKPPWET